VRTTSGGIVTIASILIILYLVWGEWAEYRKILVMPELIVDKGRGMAKSFCTHRIVPTTECTHFCLPVRPTAGTEQAR
jgi:endoplasmic reticulum-Golgi intermediate compartment protein 3